MTAGSFDVKARCPYGPRRLYKPALAEALNAAVAGSRPLIDAGWLPKNRQVGKSGHKLKPKVYLALGISGAPEHIEGMKNAATIIAVNTDSTRRSSTSPTTAWWRTSSTSAKS